MPINPQIYVPQIQPMQLQDPMVFARNALAMEEAESSIAANQLKVKRANELAALSKGRTTPLTPQDLMSAGFFGEAEELAKAENALLTGQKTEGEIIGQEMNLSRRLLEGISALPPAEKAKAYLAWHETQHTNPILKKYFDRIGIKKADADARIQTALQQPGGLDRLIVDSTIGLDKSLEQVFEQIDRGGTKEVIRFPKYGPGGAETVPGSQRTVTRSPNVQDINVISKGDTAEEVAKAQSRVKDYDSIRDRAERGRRALPTLQRASKALENFETGAFSEATTQARRVLVSLGMGTDEAEKKVQSADDFGRAVKDRILLKLSEQAGTQTEGDAVRAEETWASFNKLTDSNKFLIDLEKAIVAQDNEQLAFFDEWEEENGTYRGAAKAWREGPGSKSLFDRSEMKKYADKAAGEPEPPKGMVVNPARK
jgi:hypothetical protein